MPLACATVSQSGRHAHICVVRPTFGNQRAADPAFARCPSGVQARRAELAESRSGRAPQTSLCAFPSCSPRAFRAQRYMSSSNSLPKCARSITQVFARWSGLPNASKSCAGTPTADRQAGTVRACVRLSAYLCAFGVGVRTCLASCTGAMGRFTCAQRAAPVCRTCCWNGPRRLQSRHFPAIAGCMQAQWTVTPRRAKLARSAPGSRQAQSQQGPARHGRSSSAELQLASDPPAARAAVGQLARAKLKRHNPGAFAELVILPRHVVRAYSLWPW